MTTPELKAAVERLGHASSHYDVSIPDVDTVLNALEAAQQELVELRKDKEKLLKILKHWQSHNQLSIPTNADEGEAVGEDFTAVWYETQEALDAAIQKAT